MAFNGRGIGRLARNTFIAASLIGMALITGACSGDDDNGGGGSPGGDGIVRYSIPGLGAVRWRADGGASDFATRNGGNGGIVQIGASNVLVRGDDGRARPTVATNFLTAGVLTDNLVTYTELVGIMAPGIAGTTATFALPAGTGFLLPGGATLNLGDAPAGVVDSVVISTADLIILAGTVVTTRTTANSTAFSAVSTRNGDIGVIFTGSIDTRGAVASVTPYNGGAVGLTANTSSMIAFGTVNSSGGAGTAGFNGGNAGNIAITSGRDLLLATGSIGASGGTGGAIGGGGGIGTITGGAIAGGNFNWGATVNGGNGGTGNGGAGGISQLVIENTVMFASQIQAIGGTSASGMGGNGGTAVAISAHCRGILNAIVNGGASASGAGGPGGVAYVGGLVSEDIELVGTANGGNGTTGGNGGILIGYVDNVRGLLVIGTANGGTGTTTGGNGGVVGVGSFGGFTLSVDLARIEGTARGGDGSGPTGDGGNGGEVTYNVSLIAAGSILVSDAWLVANVNGGNGRNGGDGGYFGAQGVGGSLSKVRFAGTADGGTSTMNSGGMGGAIVLDFVDANADVDIAGSANGADGTGTVNGGQGGALSLSVNNSGTGNGTLHGTINVSNRGGSAVNGFGGTGGYTSFNVGLGGLTLERAMIDQRGGDSSNSGGGSANSVDVVVLGHAQIESGTWNASGGNGGGSNGSGGSGADDFNWYATDGSVVLNLTILINGGNGSGTGSGAGGSQDLNIEMDDDGNGISGYLVLGGNIQARGGNASGSGSGGLGGQVTVTGNAYVYVYGTIDVSGGNSNTGFGGDNDFTSIETGRQIVILGSIIGNGGNGAAGGGTGASINLGWNLALRVEIARSGIVRANGGSNNGDGGLITLDPTGAGPNNPNLYEASGSTVQANASGTGMAGTITRD